MFSAIDHLAIACQDVRAQSAWYCRLLGMRLLAAVDGEPPAALVGYDGGGALELMAARDGGPAPASAPRFSQGMRHLAIRVRDFDAVLKRLEEAGVALLGEPGSALGGGKVVSFRDPEGNELQIVERQAFTH